MMKSLARSNSHGLTLIELIVAMVVVSIALTGVLLIINYATSHSADPVLQRQSLAIAESYLEEILLKNVTDPDGGTESSRAQFDDISDYNHLPDSKVRDALGNIISGLENYQVQVAVTVLNAGLGPVGNKVDTLKVRVDVTDPVGQLVSLTGYRCDY